MFKIKNLIDKPGIGSIIKWKAEKYSSSLLGGVQADVVFEYSNGKKVKIFGDEKDVLNASIGRFKLMKNGAKAEKFIGMFLTTWNGTDVGLDIKVSKHIQNTYYPANPFSVGKPENLLNDALLRRELTVKDLANQMKAEQKESTTYTHTSGARAISREVALKYSEILKCDPLDLMFNKLTIPVWGKVDLMQGNELEKFYPAGEIFPYAANAADTEITIVPRDLWRSDIKASKVDAKGTMYHNQVAFYYFKKNNDDAALNKLCIVGMKIYPNADIDPDYSETQYYFGVYENIRGKSNLINPDPFCEEENKIILKNFKPTFVSPVVSMVNTDALVDDTNKVDSIPQSEWRKEESLRIERSHLIQKLNEKELSEKQYATKIKQINDEMKSYENKIQHQIDLQIKAQDIQIERMRARASEAEKIANQPTTFFGKKFIKKKRLS